MAVTLVLLQGYGALHITFRVVVACHRRRVGWPLVNLVLSLRNSVVFRRVVVLARKRLSIVLEEVVHLLILEP